MYFLKRFTPEDDIPELYSLIFNKNMLAKLPGQLDIRSKNEFADWLIHQLHGFFHDLYLIYDEQQVKGYLLAFDYRVYDGHCQIYGSWDRSISYEIFKEFVDWLCSEYPLRKILLYITEKEDDLMQMSKKMGFVEEARLKEYKYIDGNYVDMYVLSYSTRSDMDGR